MKVLLTFSLSVLGVMRLKANPPPPAPVSLVWRPCLAVTATTLSRLGWETPRLDSRPWFMSISSWTPHNT